MGSKLSPKMEEALARAGNGLYRWPGGYWTDTPPANVRRVSTPDWWVGTQTVQSLIGRGLLVVVDRAGRPPFPVAVEPHANFR